MKPIIISGDILCGDKISGIPRYAHEVIINLDAIMVENNLSYDIRVCYPEEKHIRLPELKKISVKAFPVHSKRFGSDVLRKYVNQEKGVWCNMGNSVSFNRGGAVCIHDIRAVQFNEFDNPNKKREMNLIKWSAKFMGTTIVTVSKYQKKMIHHYFKFPLDKIYVMPNGWEHIRGMDADMTVFMRNPDIKLGEYYYSLGSVAKHKNYKWIHEIAKKYPQKQFIVAGNIEKNVWGVDDRELHLPNVRFLGYVTDEENIALMQNCRAFLHPSKYEGFGIPPLEAVALGKKIIISNATCLPEIYKNSAAYFDPDDYEADLDQLEAENTYGSENVLNEYTWRNSAMKWLELFRIIGEK